MSEWKDTTTYSRGQKDRTPTTFSIRLTRQFSITITNAHIYYPGDWVMHLHPVFECRLLGADTLEEAKAEALQVALVEFDEAKSVIESVVLAAI